jgi:RNA polymerase sigma-70 factor (ECF subfamily)
MSGQRSPAAADPSCLPQSSDDELVRRFTAGEEDAAVAAAAFEELYDRHAKRLLAFLMSRLLPDEAEDVHQDVWQRVLQSAARTYAGGSFRGWLFQIARNQIIDRRRKRQPESTDRWDHASGDQPPPDEPLLEQERMEALRQCLERLEARMAQLVQARLGGRSYDQICLDLQLTSQAAHKMFHTAKTRLQECVQGRLGDGRR